MNFKRTDVILLTLLAQGIFIIIYDTAIYISGSFHVFKQSITFFNIVIMLLTILLIVSIRNINKYSEQELELKLLKDNLKNTEELINLLRIQKHDHINHIQTLQSMAFLEEQDKLTEYLNGIANKYRYTGKIIRVGHPALTALLNTKKELAEKNNIEFEIIPNTKINSIDIESWDFCSLIGNLVDNAIEAALDFRHESTNLIKVTIDKLNIDYIFTIENSGYLKSETIKDIFKAGFTTKGSEGRGYGLYIVKKLLDKYKGDINITANENKVITKVYLPAKE